MTHRQSKSHKKRRQQKKEGEDKTSHLRPLELTLGICTLLGGLVAAIAFLPRVAVIQTDPSDPSNPFSASFTITNTSYVPIPLHDVEVGVCPGAIVGGGIPFPASVKYFLDCGPITTPQWKNHTLGIDERFTITLEGIIGMQGRGTPQAATLGGADIFVIVSYKPWMIPWTREKGFRFRTRRHSNNTYSWDALPND
jgi:hypothetical protein